MPTYHDHLSTALATPETIADMVSVYKKRCSAIREIHRINSKHPELCIETSRGRMCFDFNLADALNSESQKAWHEIVQKSRVQEACSAKRWELIIRQIEAGDMPDFTEVNILQVVRSLGRDLPKLFEECCQEVLDWLRKSKWNKHKTNTKNARFEIGKKVIKDGMVDRWLGFSLGHRTQDILRSLHTVFKMLDGKGVARYPNDLATQIYETMRSTEDIQELITEYFKVKWFKIGTLHIEFLRDDLLAEFNAVAHGKTFREPVTANETRHTQKGTK